MNAQIEGNIKGSIKIPKICFLAFTDAQILSLGPCELTHPSHLHRLSQTLFNMYIVPLC